MNLTSRIEKTCTVGKGKVELVKYVVKAVCHAVLWAAVC